MFRLLIFQFVICHTFFDYFSVQKENLQNDQVSNMFIEWNSKTFKSLDCQLKNAKESTPYKDLISNRIEALISYLEIKDVRGLNHESIRFKFLRTLKQESILANDFYLVEIRSQGESVIIKNLLLEKLGGDSVKIIEFQYLNEQWKKIKERKEHKWDLKYPLCLERLPFGKGKNSDDLMITRFRKFKVLDSEYFIHGTLSPAIASKIEN